MSTRLLRDPGKIHELSDDLESLWLVFLYQGLHFIKHNNPSNIHINFLFDEAHVCPVTGAYAGGGERLYFYHFRAARKLKFESAPFTTLVRDIYLLFRSLQQYYVAQDNEEDPSDSLVKDVEKLKSCAEIERILRKALDSKGWPVECDKVEDQYPP